MTSEDQICPICSTKSRRHFKKYQFWILQCQRCGHQFIGEQPTGHADAVYGDDYFQGGGAGYPDYLAEADLLRSHGQRYGKILQRFVVPGQMLDVGAAAGFLLQGFHDRGWQGDGIEPNPTMAAYGRNQLGVNVQAGTLETLDQVLPGQTYDLVSMIQVLPHFYDLHKALQSAAEVTCPGGYWLIETWNRSSLTAKLSGQHWHEYSPPSVLHWFAPDDVRRLAAQYDFQEVAFGRPQKWIKGSHVKSLLSYKLKDVPLGRWLIPLVMHLPDQMRLPYPAEDLFWILLRGPV
jgi:SAM-dependent methyltransferase